MTRLALALMLSLPCSALAEDSFPFAPARDPFTPNALLDLRSLNEKVAGESGFVTVDANGDFRLGNGEKVRFWAVNTGVEREKPWVKRPQWSGPEPKLDYHARFLAKHGVNMVRLHSHLNPEPTAKLTDVNEKERDWIWRTVAAMKKEGIYTTISPYWPNTLKIGESWGIPGGANQSTHGLLFFDETLQSGYKGWWKALLAEKNPYTGIPLAQDASVGILQLQNEDSLLFWTTNALQGEQRRRLGKKFGDWCIKKYGSLEETRKAWSNEKLPGDDLTKGVLDFQNLYFATIPTKGGTAKRMDDQIEFWCRVMYNFHIEMAKYLREELGCKQVINAGNWKTANTPRLGDAERWTYTANEVLAVNRYFGGMHTGPNNGWAVVTGDQFTKISALRDPRQLPINLRQPRGKAMIVTESSWVMPNGFGAEGPFLLAAYMSLNGIDGYYWFATGDEGWANPQSANGYMPSASKWSFASPDILGTFPAAALLYRKGYIQEAAPVIFDNRPITDLWQRKIPRLSEESSFDPNRDTGNLPPKLDVAEVLPWETFLVGPVQVIYDGKAASITADLSKWIDRSSKKVSSRTNELTLDHGKGICVMNAPKAQGVAAFAGGKFNTLDLVIELNNEYGTISVVPLDDQPLKDSGKMLVQFGMDAKPTGWKESPTQIVVKEGKFDGFKIDDHGRSPWRIASPRGKLTIHNAKLSKAFVLDANGYSVRELKLEKSETGVSFDFPSDALYVIVQK